MDPWSAEDPLRMAGMYEFQIDNLARVRRRVWRSGHVRGSMPLCERTAQDLYLGWLRWLAERGDFEAADGVGALSTRIPNYSGG